MITTRVLIAFSQTMGHDVRDINHPRVSRPNLPLLGQLRSLSLGVSDVPHELQASEYADD
jgi:hypothetical protein